VRKALEGLFNVCMKEVLREVYRENRREEEEKQKRERGSNSI